MPWNKIFPSNPHTKELFAFREAMESVYILERSESLGGGRPYSPVSFLSSRVKEKIKMRWDCRTYKHPGRQKHSLEDPNLRRPCLGTWLQLPTARVETCRRHSTGFHVARLLFQSQKSWNPGTERPGSSRVVIQRVNCPWPLGEISHPNQNTTDFIDSWANKKPEILV